MFNPYHNMLIDSLVVVIFLFIGCKNEKKPVQIYEHEQTTILDRKELSGVNYGFIKGIVKKEEKYFASIVFLDYQLKSEEDEIRQKKSLRQFPDSLEVLELPDAYLLNVKRKKPELILIDKSVHILMQTLNYDSTGNFSFNENITLNRFFGFFTTQESQRYEKIPFKITLFNNEINSVTELYLP